MSTVPDPPESPPPTPLPPLTKGFLDYLEEGLAYYYLTSLIAMLGVVFGHDFIKLPNNPLAKTGDLLSSFAVWDGEWYKQIITDGYNYNPETPSSVAFFPAYPLLGKVVVICTGWRPEIALLLVSHICLVGSFVVLAAYLSQRYGNTSQQLCPYVLLSLGLFPTTFFCRMAYNESLFLFCTILALYGMERRWPLLIIAGIIGLATATRAVGVGLILPLVLNLWDRSATVKTFLTRGALLLPVACWGISGYILYQYLDFGEPFAFVQTQENWRMRPAVPLLDKVIDLASFEPIISVFNPSSPCYWHRHEPNNNPLFSLHVTNSFYFVLAVVLIIVGARKRWLSRYELSLSACLLLIPYLTRSHEFCMGSMGRFAAAVFPVYLVLGQLFCRIPAPMAAVLLSVSGFLLGTYAALFASWHRFF